MTQETILLTGFEPFGDHAINPSALVAEALDGERVGTMLIRTATLPVDGARIEATLHELIALTKPRVVLALGLAAGRAALNVERVALNVRDYAITDNAGARPEGLPIVTDGPDAYLATLPAAEIVRAIRAAGVPARLSDSAGTYLCNQALYLLCHLNAARDPVAPCGFIHLPALPAQVATHPDLPLSQDGGPTMDLATMLIGIRAALAAAVHYLKESASLQLPSRT